MGGGPAKIDRQHRAGKMAARERIAALLAPARPFSKSDSSSPTAQSPSLATLELWVHTPPIEPLTTYVSVAAEIPDDLQITVFDQEALPPDWQEDPAPASLRDLGTRCLCLKPDVLA